MESAISSVKDDTSSHFISGLQVTKLWWSRSTSSVKDDTSSQFISGLQETKLCWSRSPPVSTTTRLRSLFLDTKKRSFDGVGHHQCQRRHVFAVYFWTPRNEALMESVISSAKDDASSKFISGLQETELSWSRSSAV